MAYGLTNRALPKQEKVSYL